MYRLPRVIRPPVKRLGAEKYLLFTLLSFAASVSVTRLFLELTGYPQLGGGEIHIAHVLWGGLLLYVAAILPLLFANRWVYTFGAILAGIGVGLFIDEVGKFITASNDYFTPLAAPIIYAFFLLSVLVFSRVKRLTKRNPREELYRVFDAMEEIMEHDLDRQEWEELEERLDFISRQSDHPEFIRLANDLHELLASKDIEIKPDQKTLWEHVQDTWSAFERRWINHTLLKAGLAVGLLALGMLAIWNLSLTLPINLSPGRFEQIMERMVSQGLVSSQAGKYWYLTRIGLESSIGLLLLSASILFMMGRDHLGATIGYISLLLSLTVVNLLVYYFDQFSSIILSCIQLTLLLGVINYRRRFLANHRN